MNGPPQPFSAGERFARAVTVTPKQHEALVRAYREKGSLRFAARKARVAQSEAYDILRSEGFDLETRDWFFESAAAFYRHAWARLHPLRVRALRLGSRVFGRIPGAARAGAWLRERARRAGVWLVAWSARHPVRKSVTSLILASLFLTAYWVVDPEWEPLAMGLFFVTFAAGAVLLYVHTRSPRLLGSAGVVLIASGAYALSEGLGAAFGLSFRATVALEAFRAGLVPLIGWAFLDAITQATGFLERLRVHVPVVSSALTLGLFVVGTVLACVELYLVTAYSVDPAAVRYIARYNLSYVLWGLASASLVFTHVYLFYLALLTSKGRVTTRRVAVGMATGVLLIAFVGANLATVLVLSSGGAGAMRLGIHASSVDAALQGPWDPFVHLEVSWADVETVPGVKDWSHFDAQLDTADRQGIEVYLLVGTTPPAWFQALHMDAAMRDRAGNVFYWIDTDPRSESRRVWDFSFADGAVVTAKEAFTREATARYAPRPSVVAVAIQNEPAWPADWDPFRLASYDSYTLGTFYGSLQGRYATVEAFNAVHGTAYRTWADLAPPTDPASPLWAEWLAFREGLLTAFVQRLTAAVRAETAKPVTVKILSHYLARYGIVQTGLTERVLRAFVNASDVVSVDLYPLSRGDLKRSLVYYRGLAGGKPLWVSEFNLFLGCAAPTTGSTMFGALVEMSRFAERTILFTWEDHYLYGLRQYPSEPGLVGTRMFRDLRDGRSPFSSYGGLVAADLGAVPNLYTMYVLASAFANLPVVPWLVLILFIVPVPLADPARRRLWKKRIRIVAVVLLVVGTILANFAS